MKRLALVLALWASFSCAVLAQVGGLSFPGPGPAHSAGGGGTPTYTFLASPAWQDNPGSSATFASQPLGTVGANNYTVVGIQMTNGAGTLTVTIGGSSATVYNPGGGGTAVAWALTPSSTGSIVVNNGASITSVSIQVSQITNVTQVGTPTSNTAFGVQSGTWNVGSGVAVPTNGIAYVSVFVGSTAGTGFPVSGMTLDFANPIVDGGGPTAESFSAHTTTSGTLTPTITFSSGTNAAAAIVVFGP